MLEGMEAGWTQSLERLIELVTRARGFTVRTSNMAATNRVAMESGERAVVITRVFDAPRSLVFKAWTDPEHLMRWWGPHGFTISSCKMDLRAGGAWRICMRGPDGHEDRQQGVFREIVEPERLVFTYAFENEAGKPGHQTIVTVTFTDLGPKDQTNRASSHFRIGRGSQRSRTWMGRSAGSPGRTGRAGLIDKPRRKIWIATSSVAKEIGERELTITRVFDAPRDLVFKAGLTRRQARWLGPKGFTTISVQMEGRVGGSYRLGMRAPDGSAHWLCGVHREIVEPERLVFTSYWEDANGQPGHETLITLTFDD